MWHLSINGLIWFSDTKKNSLTNWQFSFPSPVDYTQNKQVCKYIPQRWWLRYNDWPALSSDRALQQWQIMELHMEYYLIMSPRMTHWLTDCLSVRYNVTLTLSCEIDWLAKSVYTTQISCRSSIVLRNPSAAIFRIKLSKRKVPSFELLQYACPNMWCHIPTQLQLWQIDISSL